MSRLGICFFVIAMSLKFNTKCWSQATENTVRAGKPSATIILNEAMDGSFTEYFFYNDTGQLVKKIRHDQFESKSPIYSLNALKYKLNDTLEDYYHPLEQATVRAGRKTPVPAVIDELKSLKKIGLIVKFPEKADMIIGGPKSNIRPIASLPKCKYLINVETATILDYSAEEMEGRSNALLDCSYLTIYNYMGESVKEILIPDKIVTNANVSDDGNFLMCSYSYTHLWDEGTDWIPDGILVADLQSKKIDYISRIETKNSLDPASVLFADGYFQATIGNPYSGDACVRIYINPYDRKYYIKSYGEDRQKNRKAIFSARSFSQFESMIEDIRQFESFAY